TDSFWFAEAIFSVSRVNGGASGITSISGSFSSEQRFAVGTSWANVQNVISAIPGLSGLAVPSLGSLPGGLTAGPSHFYVGAGVNERDISLLLTPTQQLGTNWLIAPEIVLGQLNRLSNGMVLDTWLKYQPQSTTLQLPFTGQNYRTGDFIGFG